MEAKTQDNYCYIPDYHWPDWNLAYARREKNDFIGVLFHFLRQSQVAQAGLKLGVAKDNLNF